MVKSLLTLCTLTTPLPSHPPVCCPCVKASVLLALGPLPPGCPPMPVPFLAGATQPYAGSCGGPRMGGPHHVHVASCAKQHAVHLHLCMLRVLLHWERGLKATSPPHGPLCRLCALEVGACGENVAAADREMDVWTALGGSLLRSWLKLPCLPMAFVSRCFWPQVGPSGQRLRSGFSKTRRTGEDGPARAWPKSTLLYVFLWTVPWASPVQAQAGQFSMDASSLHC